MIYICRQVRIEMLVYIVSLFQSISLPVDFFHLGLRFCLVNSYGVENLHLKCVLFVFALQKSESNLCLYIPACKIGFSVHNLLNMEVCVFNTQGLSCC